MRAIVATFILSVLFLLANWGNISGSEWFQKAFHRDAWERKQKELEEFQAKFDAFQKRECAILIKAREAILPIEFEEDALLQIDSQESRSNKLRELEADRKLCEEHGIAPYSRTRN